MLGCDAEGPKVVHTDDKPARRCRSGSGVPEHGAVVVQQARSCTAAAPVAAHIRHYGRSTGGAYVPLWAGSWTAGSLIVSR